MTKKNFIALADLLRNNGYDKNGPLLNLLAEFCKQQSSQFNRERWLAYIAGECGPNGRSVKGGDK